MAASALGPFRSLDWLIRDVLLVVKGVLYLVDLWSVETGLEYDESDVPKDTR